MSRYFDLKLFRRGQSQTPAYRWATHPNGSLDPNYPSIRFDIINAGYNSPTGGASIRINGISLQSLKQSAQFSQDAEGSIGGMIFSLWGGMAQGLPLANPKQNGLLFTGQVYQSFGNWEGSGMSLDLLVSASTLDADDSGISPIVFVWEKGSTLKQALQDLFTNTFPSYQVEYNILPVINLNDNIVHFSNTLEGFAQWLLETTAELLDPNYPGVRIAINPSRNPQAPTIYLFDNYNTSGVTEISFFDLIGQPTWIETNVLQFKTPMRGDLHINSRIRLPKEMQNIPIFALSQAASNPALLKYATTFSGEFIIRQVRHIGDSRNPSADAWVSVFDCVPENIGDE